MVHAGAAEGDRLGVAVASEHGWGELGAPAIMHHDYIIYLLDFTT